MDKKYLVRQFVSMLANALKGAEQFEYMFPASERLHINTAYLFLTDEAENKEEMERCLNERNISLLKHTYGHDKSEAFVFGFRYNYTGKKTFVHVNLPYLAQKFANDVRAANEILRNVFEMEKD